MFSLTKKAALKKAAKNKTDYLTGMKGKHFERSDNKMFSEITAHKILFEECTFTNISLTSNLKNVIFDKCSFENCLFDTNEKTDWCFSKCVFIYCRFASAEVFYKDALSLALSLDINIKQSVFCNVSFNVLRQGMLIESCNLFMCDFDKLSLKNIQVDCCFLHSCSHEVKQFSVGSFQALAIGDMVQIGCRTKKIDEWISLDYRMAAVHKIDPDEWREAIRVIKNLKTKKR